MTTEAPEGTPDLIPARMLNEFVYCPRLFYLEWVDHRWADSDDTEAGRFVHRRVDKAGGTLPPSKEIIDLLQARSVELADAELGLVAVVDRVDTAEGAATPVDLKKGAPDREGRPWPADEIQLLVQAVLLRRAGYRVDSGTLYYAQTNQRIQVPIPDDAEEKVRAVATDAREVAGSARPPLPLVDSAKCPRCSLVSICLPDETNRLLDRAQTPPRRIVPRDPDHRPVYVSEQGSFVGVKGGRLVVTTKGEARDSVRLIDVSQLCVFGHVQVSTEALTRLWARGVPVLWFSFGGWLNGWAQGEMSRYVELRRRQVVAHSHGGGAIAAMMLAGKIRNARTLLRRNSRSPISPGILDSMKSLERDVREAKTTAQMMGFEGTAARLYFGQFSRMLAAQATEMAIGFDFTGRNRRPPRDPVNCLLSFLYGLLVKDLVATCIGVGLDPFIGVLHGPRFGRPALALDLAEEFRPLIADSVVIQVINNREVGLEDFRTSARGVFLSSEARRRVISAYERRLDMTIRHPVFGYTISYRRVLDVQARIVAAVMIGELSTYTPLTTR